MEDSNQAGKTFIPILSEECNFDMSSDSSFEQNLPSLCTALRSLHVPLNFHLGGIVSRKNAKPYTEKVKTDDKDSSFGTKSMTSNVHVSGS